MGPLSSNPCALRKIFCNNIFFILNFALLARLPLVWAHYNLFWSVIHQNLFWQGEKKMWYSNWYISYLHPDFAGICGLHSCHWFSWCHTSRALLYQSALKDHRFRALCFWSQLFLGFSGMLDLLLVLQLNLKLGIPDHLFAVLDECTNQFVVRLKYMPLLILSAKLCPPGIEGTFFALIMSIGNMGLFSSSWLGGILLHSLRITRTQFHNLWVAILIHNIARIFHFCSYI